MISTNGPGLPGYIITQCPGFTLVLNGNTVQCSRERIIHLFLALKVFHGNAASPFHLPFPLASCLLPHLSHWCPSTGFSCIPDRAFICKGTLFALKALISSHIEPKLLKRNPLNNSNWPNTSKLHSTIRWEHSASNPVPSEGNSNPALGLILMRAAASSKAPIQQITEAHIQLQLFKTQLTGVNCDRNDWCCAIPSPPFSHSYRLLLRCVQRLVSFFQPCNCTKQWNSQPEQVKVAEGSLTCSIIAEELKSRWNESLYLSTISNPNFRKEIHFFLF